MTVKEKYFDTYQIIIQFKIKGKWWEPSDLIKRDKMKNILENLFLKNKWFYDGWDLGSWTMNIFCFTPNPENITNLIVKEMEINNFDNNYIIAKQKDEDISVIYPEDYIWEFNY